MVWLGGEACVGLGELVASEWALELSTAELKGGVSVISGHVFAQTLKPLQQLGSRYTLTGWIGKYSTLAQNSVLLQIAIFVD